MAFIYNSFFKFFLGFLKTPKSKILTFFYSFQHKIDRLFQILRSQISNFTDRMLLK